MSDNEDGDEEQKKGHTTIGHTPLFKPVSHNGNLPTTSTREDNGHELASPGTQLPTQPPANVILTNIEEENISSKSLQDDLLQCHCCLGHCSFTRLRLLAALGIIPRKLLKVKPPKCDGCLYGAMKKCPWRTKSARNQGSIRKAYSLG